MKLHVHNTDRRK